MDSIDTSTGIGFKSMLGDRIDTLFLSVCMNEWMNEWCQIIFWEGGENI